MTLVSLMCKGDQHRIPDSHAESSKLGRMTRCCCRLCNDVLTHWAMCMTLHKILNVVSSTPHRQRRTLHTAEARNYKYSCAYKVGLHVSRRMYEVGCQPVRSLELHTLEADASCGLACSCIHQLVASQMLSPSTPPQIMLGFTLSTLVPTFPKHQPHHTSFVPQSRIYCCSLVTG